VARAAFFAFGGGRGPAGFRVATRVGRARRPATGVPDEWPSPATRRIRRWRGQNPAYRPSGTFSLFLFDRVLSPPAWVFLGRDGRGCVIRPGISERSLRNLWPSRVGRRDGGVPGFPPVPLCAPLPAAGSPLRPCPFARQTAPAMAPGEGSNRRNSSRTKEEAGSKESRSANQFADTRSSVRTVIRTGGEPDCFVLSGIQDIHGFSAATGRRRRDTCCAGSTGGLERQRILDSTVRIGQPRLTTHEIP